LSIPVQAFTVLTEFKFDVGAAIANSSAVEGAVNKISTAAENVQFALARMSLSFAGSFLGGGGVLGALALASKVSDDFANSQISLANTLVMTGMAFEDRMLASKTVMEDLNKIAIENSLNFKELLNTTKLLTPMLLNKGLAGQNLSNVKDISRTFLKSAPTLGIDPQEAMGQLLRTIEGQASMGDTLFTRLTAETAPMKEFLNNTKKWKDLQPHKRIALLREALAQFANDSDAVKARVMTLSGQLAALRNNIELLIRPIGEVINKFMATALSRINSPELMGRAKKVFADLAGVLENFLQTPEKLYADIAQAKALAGDVKASGSIVGTIAISQGIIWLLSLFKIKIPTLGSVITAAGKSLGKGIKSFGVGSLKGLMGATWAGLMRGFMTGSVFLVRFSVGLNSLVTLLSGFIVPVLVLTAMFQLLSRAMAYAKMFALEELARQLPRIVKAFSALSSIFSILNSGFDFFARMLGSVLDPSKFLGFINIISIFASILEWVSEKLGQAMMGVQGFFFVLFESVNQLMNVFRGNIMDFSTEKIQAAGDAGMQDMYEKIFGKIDKGEGGIVNQVVNMDVKMQNNFKEMLEPDRVAFTIRDQLLKANRNKTGASGRGMEAQQ